MTAKEIEKRLHQVGWYCVRQKGGHKHFGHKDYGYVITIPQHKGDIAIGTVNNILKSAGIKK